MTAQTPLPLRGSPRGAAVLGVSGTQRPGSWHAAHRSTMDAHGWARALCSWRLWVSVDHVRGDQPLYASTEVLPILDDGDVVAQAPDCLRCMRVLRAHPEWDYRSAA